MNEYSKAIRRAHVERMNGYVSTWLYYNKLTLWCAFLALATLGAITYTERELRFRAERDAYILASSNPAMSLGCYEKDRSTSLIIAGGNQKLVDDALRDAAQQVMVLRLNWIIARDRQLSEYKGTRP